MAKMNIKKGDKVKVLAGKDKGAEGIVIASNPSAQRVTVEKVNMMKKAMRPTQANPEGGIATESRPFPKSVGSKYIWAEKVTIPPSTPNDET